MTLKSSFLLCFIILITSCTAKKISKKDIITPSISTIDQAFHGHSDTQFGFVSKSFKIDCDTVRNIRVTKKIEFQYIGKDSVLIPNQCAGIRNKIYDYPKKMLKKDTTYNIDFFFVFGGSGNFNKRRSFCLSNGKRITYRFSGFVLLE